MDTNNASGVNITNTDGAHTNPLVFINQNDVSGAGAYGLYIDSENAAAVALLVESAYTTALQVNGMCQLYGITVSEKTDDYTVTTSDLGKSFRMRAGAEKTFNLPSVGIAQDGARVTFVKGDASKVIINAADTDTIADSSAGGTIYNDTASVGDVITLEYYHAITKWVLLGGSGTWVTT